MAYIGREPTNTGEFLLIDDISSNFDGETKSFTLKVGTSEVTPAAANTVISVDGVLQQPSSSYSISGSTITFTGAPDSGLSFYGVLAGQSQYISNNSITNDHISGTANISGSKINTNFGAQSFQLTNITASGDISASGTVFADNFQSAGGDSAGISFTDDFNLTGNFTASGDISGSATTTGSFGSLRISSPQTLTVDNNGTISGSATSTGSFGRVIVAEMGNSDLTDVSASISTRVNLLEGSGSITESSASFSTRVNLLEGSGSINDLVTDSGSFSTRVNLLEGSGSITESSSSFSTRVSDLVTDSGSFSTRVNLLEGSGSITESSASFSTRVNLLEGSGSINDLVTASGSFSTRVSDLKTDSGSFSTRVTTTEASGALFDGDGVVTFAGATITGTLTAQEVHTEFISASVTVSTGSNIFGDETGDVHQFTGSIETSGSIILDTLGGNVSGSIVSTGSFGAANIAGMTVSNLVDVSSSLSSRLTDVKTESGSFAAASSSYSSASGSLSTRVSDLKTDSGSFAAASSSYSSASGSLSTRVSDLVTDSGSFSTRVSDLNLSLSGSTSLISGSVTSTGSFGSVVAGGTGVNAFLGGNIGVGHSAPLAPIHISKDVTQVDTAATSRTNAGLYLNFDPTFGSTSLTMFAMSSSIATVGTQGMQVGNSNAGTVYPLSLQPFGGSVFIGSGKPITVGGYNPAKVSVQGTAFSGVISVIEHQDDISGGMISIGKSRGAAVDAVTILEDNDVVGRILFSSADGVDFRTISAEIRTQVDGTPGANDVPGSLYFKTNDGSANDPIDRMFISASGEVGIGIVTPDALLHVKGAGGGNSISTFEDSTGNSNILIRTVAANKNSIINFGDADSVEIGQIDYDHNGNSMKFLTNGSERMNIDGIGAITVTNNTLNPDGASHTSFFVSTIKTAGSSDASDTFMGYRNHLEWADGDQGWGNLYGWFNNTQISAGAGESTAAYAAFNKLAWESADANNLFGAYTEVICEGGTVDTNVFGQLTFVNIDSGVTLSNAVYGQQIKIDGDVNPSDAYYGLQISMQGGAVHGSDDFFMMFFDDQNDDIVAQITALAGVATFDSGDFSGAPDYAEYFESKDGKIISPGTTVKLDGDKVVPCEDGDTPIGVARPDGTSAIVGNAKTLGYTDKYLKTDYDEIILEDYKLVQWVEEIEFDTYKANQNNTKPVLGGNVRYYTEEGTDEAITTKYFRKHSYHSDRLPSGVTVPSNATTQTPAHQRKKLNPDYDPSLADDYKGRATRDEWCLVGLLGQIPITKGQPLASNWIKMRDVSDTVELYFVK